MDPIFRNKEKFEPEAKKEGTDLIKTLASGELPGIEVSPASLHKLKRFTVHPNER